MPSYLRRFAFLCAFVCTCSLHAQQFNIQKVYTEKGKVHVVFKISGNHDFERYRIQLYSSHDNYQNPLRYVTGPGSKEDISNTNEELKLVWDAQRELRKFDGDLQLELKGEVSYVPVHLNSKDLKAQHTKATTISWKGGSAQDQIRVELVKEGKVVESLGQVTNTGRYEWTVPQNIPKGAGYNIRLVNLTNPGENAQTNSFKIGSKLSLIVKLAPVGVLAGVAVYGVVNGWFGGDGNGDGSLVDPVGVPE